MTARRSCFASGLRGAMWTVRTSWPPWPSRVGGLSEALLMRRCISRSWLRCENGEIFFSKCIVLIYKGGRDLRHQRDTHLGAFSYQSLKTSWLWDGRANHRRNRARHIISATGPDNADPFFEVIEIQHGVFGHKRPHPTWYCLYIKYSLSKWP